jgi:membrane protease YdiL (CAAX protease family)
MNRKPTQGELVKTLSNRELILNLYFTQLILVAAALLSGFFLFGSLSDFRQYFQWRPVDVLMLGGGTAVSVVIIDLLLMKWLPKAMYDDGGINERIFSVLSIPHIFFVTAVIALVEESLFRGVIQSHFGIIIASLVFALIHVRYLRKKLLFFVTVGLSFWLGVLFLYTQNLFVCVFAHFCIDFFLGIIIRCKHIHSDQTGEEEE